MVEPNKNFPQARKGLEHPKGGFGFSGPSEAWLKANGMQTSYSGHSGSIESSSVSTEELNERRRKALERFNHPEKAEVVENVVEREVKKKVNEEEIRERQRIAQIREENLKRNQMELDSVVVQEEVQEVKVRDEDKRKKCLALGNIKKEQVKVVKKYEGVSFLGMFERIQPDFFIVTREGVRVPAHRTVLMARSSFFMVMLGGDSVESRTGELYLPEFSEEVVKSILEFLYSGQVRTSNNCILELLYLADFLKLENLKILIQIKLCEFVSVENLIDLWELSENMKLHMLSRKCEELMKTEKEIRKIVPEMPKELKTLYLQLIKKK